MKSLLTTLLITILVLTFQSTIVAQWLPTGVATDDAKYRSGSIGIGLTSAPLTGTTLQLHNTTGPILRLSNATSTVNATLGTIIGRGNGYSFDAAKIDMNIDAQNWSGGNYPSRLSFWTTPNNTGGALTERMRIDNQGNVGIGTTSPLTNLHILNSSGSTFTLANNSSTLNALIGSLIGRGQSQSYNGAKIDMNIDASAWTTTSKPTRISFWTTVSGSSTLIERMRINNAGNIGIGTTNPLSKLDILGGLAIGSYAGVNAAPSNGMIVSGNVGIGTTTPGQKLEVNGNIKIPWTGKMMLGDNGTAYIQGFQDGQDVEGLKFFTAQGYSGGAMIIKTTGQVGIGKSPNTIYHLDVNGKIRANEVVVNTDGSDFVFEDNYKLRSLYEVETFIKENKHLPEIPNAEEMQQNGMSLSEMNTKLLQKVEELTLYIIDQEKRIKNLEDKNEK